MAKRCVGNAYPAHQILANPARYAHTNPAHPTVAFSTLSLQPCNTRCSSYKTCGLGLASG
jgi:hypothetical protein